MSFPSISPYRITRILGQGGMGVVYEAVHEKIERRVAIKVLRPEAVHDKELAQRFLNEARAVNLVGHPGLVQVSDYGHSEGSPYIVMELLDGETLQARMTRSGGKLPLVDAMRIAQKTAEVLAATHGKGIIHRDLKPDNVMLIADTQLPDGERVKILDFGVAKLIENAPRATQAMMGTPHYMAPEQCQDTSAVTGKADVYSLGVMLFETLTGRLPFLAEGVVQQVTKKLLSDAPRLSEVSPELPPAVCALVDRLLSRDVEKRPEMDALSREFEQLLNALRSGAVPLANAEGRRPRWLSFGAAGLLLCGALGVYLGVRKPASTSAPQSPPDLVQVPPPKPADSAPSSKSELEPTAAASPAVTSTSTSTSTSSTKKRPKKVKATKQMEYEK